MIAFIVSTHINADDVALADHPGTGDAVAHFIIDGNTGASREAAVSKKGRLCALRENEFVDLAIDLRGGDTGLDRRSTDKQSLCRNSSGVPHGGELGSGFKHNHGYASRIARSCAVIALISWVPSTVKSLPASR